MIDLRDSEWRASFNLGHDILGMPVCEAHQDGWPMHLAFSLFKAQVRSYGKSHHKKEGGKSLFLVGGKDGRRPLPSSIRQSPYLRLSSLFSFCPELQGLTKCRGTMWAGDFALLLVF
jgi:hypothetical protein